MALRQLLGKLDGFLGFDCKFIYVHDVICFVVI